MTDYNCNKRCGICCMVTDARLTIEEVKSKKYKTKTSYKKFRKGYIEEGLSGMSLKHKGKYIPDLNKLKKVCVYFDPDEKDCMIYDDRPEICRVWNCKKEWSNGVAVIANWEKLLRENKNDSS